VYTGMFPILDCTGKMVESCGTSISRTMFVMRTVWVVGSDACTGGESARGLYLMIMQWCPGTNMYAEVRIYLCMCTCARTHQDFEYQLQAADAECIVVESEAGLGKARQDQHGTEKFEGKVSCVMCCDTSAPFVYNS